MARGACMICAENNRHGGFEVCWGSDANDDVLSSRVGCIWSSCDIELSTENVAHIPLHTISRLRFGVEEKQGRVLCGRSACVSCMLERSKEDGEREERMEYVPF